jgi:hypothetical protein
MEGNLRVLEKKQVVDIEAFTSGMSQEEKDNIEILIATPESVMCEIEQTLEQHGLRCYVRIDSVRYADMMERLFIAKGTFRTLSALPVGYHNCSLEVYMAKFYKDKQLRGEYHIPNWIVPIQVGAKLSKERVADILDCDGDNISEKNVNYSELTALYWLWKNRLLSDDDLSGSEYYGLSHYRRMLSLTDDDLSRLVDNEVDAVLPYPMIYEPDIEEHHKRYLKEADWSALLNALKELQPEYAEKFTDILKQQYLYNYNIILAKNEVIADYCGWLFPILERVEQLSTPKGSERADRYIGYMGETLETLYFMYNHDKLNIVHTGCWFLV